MQMIDGHRSLYSLTGRDSLPDPLLSLDAELLNRAADCLTKIEQWAQNTVTVVPQAARTPALLFSVQRWLWTCSSVSQETACLLEISPAFLEDAGIIPRQSAAPARPLVSLAQDVTLSVPGYTALTKNLSGILGANRFPQPAWVSALKSVPLFEFSVRLFQGTGTDVFRMETPIFFDAGNGVSPRIFGNIIHSTPDKHGVSIPQSTYEICLLVVNWAD